MVSIGCCYNLLSEKGIHEADFQSGFPMSKGANSASLFLGKRARDLACQVCVQLYFCLRCLCRYFLDVWMRTFKTSTFALCIYCFS